MVQYTSTKIMATCYYNPFLESPLLSEKKYILDPYFFLASCILQYHKRPSDSANNKEF